MSDRAIADGSAVGDNGASADTGHTGNVVSISPPSVAANDTARLTIAINPRVTRPKAV